MGAWTNRGELKGWCSKSVATGLTPIFKSAVAFKGPVLIAIYTFTAVLALAAIGDAKVVFGGGISGAPRIARHLWRMCLGLTLATGSAFTNGFVRLLPGPCHVPPIFFYPQFLPLGTTVLLDDPRTLHGMGHPTLTWPHKTFSPAFRKCAARLKIVRD